MAGKARSQTGPHQHAQGSFRTPAPPTSGKAGQKQDMTAGKDIVPQSFSVLRTYKGSLNIETECFSKKNSCIDLEEGCQLYGPWARWDPQKLFRQPLRRLVPSSNTHSEEPTPNLGFQGQLLGDPQTAPTLQGRVNVPQPSQSGLFAQLYSESLTFPVDSELEASSNEAHFKIILNPFAHVNINVLSISYQLVNRKIFFR